MIKNRRIWLLSACVGILFAGGIYWWKAVRLHLEDYNPQRDTAFILDMFQKNWYWLIAEGSDFDPSYMLKYRASSKNPAHLGNEIIRVLFKGSTPVGFVIYHKQKFHKGKIHFVLIDEKARTKGYGLFLVKSAIKELIARGSVEIVLVTRENNYAAQSIYKKAGFKETDRVDKFVYFKYTVDQ